MNSYITIEELKDDLGLVDETQDLRLLECCEQASRTIDLITGRTFYTTAATKYYDGNTPLDTDDFISITTLQTDEDGDLDYDNTLAVTDYLTWPYNTYPKSRLKISPNSDYGSFGSGDKSVKITGVFGYGDGISDSPYVNSGTTVLTTCTTGAALLYPAEFSRDYLRVGDTARIDTEQVYIKSKSASAFRIDRAVNGSTAASHAAGATIYTYKYPKDIITVCRSIACRLYQDLGKTLQSERLGDYGYTKLENLPSFEKDILERYVRQRID